MNQNILGNFWKKKKNWKIFLDSPENFPDSLENFLDSPENFPDSLENFPLDVLALTFYTEKWQVQV